MTFTFYHWGLLALFLMSAELFFPGAFLLWFGIGAAFTSLLAFLIPALLPSSLLLSFACFSFLSFLGGKKVYKKSLRKSKLSSLNQRAQGYVGQTFILTTPIVNGMSTLNIHDTLWKIKGPDLPKETLVVIKKFEDGAFVVEAFKKN